MLSPTPTTGSPQPPVRKRVLLVENDADVRLRLKKQLQGGHEAVEVRGVRGVAEVAAALRDELGWDAVVVDIGLPQSDLSAAERDEVEQLLGPDNEGDPDGLRLARWLRPKGLPLFGVSGKPAYWDNRTHDQCSEWFRMNGGRRRQFGVYDKEYQFALLRHHLYEALGVVSKVKVFIVHCHETPWLERFKSFAKELGFTHLTLDRREGEDRDWENEHWQTLVEQRVEESSLAWVLHTPDELVTSTRTPNAPPELRTRPNVVFEHGYLFGRYGRVKGRVFVFCCDGAVLPTDMRDLKGIPVRDQLDGSTKQAIRDKLGNWLPVGS